MPRNQDMMKTLSSLILNHNQSSLRNSHYLNQINKGANPDKNPLTANLRNTNSQKSRKMSNN